MSQSSCSLPLYDAHCHLQDSRLHAALPNVLADLTSISLQKIVVNGTCESDWDQVLQLAGTDSRIIRSVGLHPWYVSERTSSWLEKLKTTLTSTPCAVGEIGLDRWMEDCGSAAQEDVFVQQLSLASALNRPVSIHCLKAWGRLLEILRNEQCPATGFLLHSYGGPAEMISAFTDLGAYFSFSAYFAHSRKAKQRGAFLRVPMDRLLLETDAPDMSPPPELQEFKIGEGVNHPANIRAIYKFAAGLFNQPLEEFARCVERNFQRLFAPCLADLPCTVVQMRGDTQRSPG
jgi:TatD DNase family protein